MSESLSAAQIARNTVMRPVWKLIGGAPTMTMREMAQQLGVSVAEIDHFWTSCGFPKADPDSYMFTEQDAQAIGEWKQEFGEGTLGRTTVTSLLRAQSYMADRLVLWQLEAIVTDFQERMGLDDTSARLVVLDKIDEYIDLLQSQLGYAWRRQMAYLLLNTNREVEMREGKDAATDSYPLERSMGFVDMVAYTRRSSTMSGAALADLVQSFEMACRDVITTRGGRVVKTLGDAVLYVADDLLVAADIVCSIVELLKSRPEILPVRASLVHGRVVSRSGDIFGPPVNLASRLVDIAPRGQILMDADSAKQLQATDNKGYFAVRPATTRDLQGVGEVEGWLLTRGHAQQGEQPFIRRSTLEIAAPPVKK